MKLGSILAVILLGLIVAGHLLRLALRIPVQVGGIEIPWWTSMLGFVVPGAIAAQVWRERTESASSPATQEAHASLSADGKEELSAYLEYNKILRSWFVAFGVGGPALFLINAQIGKKLADNGELRYVSALFLVGAGFQVSGALINKVANWYVYRGASDLAYQQKHRFKFCRWLVHQFWIDVGLDLATVAAYGFATWHLFTVFGSG